MNIKHKMKFICANSSIHKQTKCIHFITKMHVDALSNFVVDLKALNTEFMCTY